MSSRILLCFCAIFFFAGCGTCPPSSQGGREFHLPDDGFAFANELRWEYAYDTNHVWRGHPRQPPAAYSLHCFPMARAARCFFYHARFEPNSTPLSVPEYRARVQEIVSRPSRCPSAPKDRIEIPGFSNLFDFSKAEEDLLKTECGGAARSYLQRGNWRMVFPFSRATQAKAAEDFVEELQEHHLPLIHVVDFPTHHINHFMLILAAEKTERSIAFTCYDPNAPGQAAGLSFDRVTRRFTLPANAYYHGGSVNVYEVEKTLFE